MKDYKTFKKKLLKNKKIKKIYHEMNQRNTIYVFIDASNVWEAQKAKGRFFDFEK